MLRIIVIILLGISMAGYVSWFIYKRNLNLWLAPAAVITGICFFMYLSGLINVMALTAYLILGGGIICFLGYFLKVPWIKLLRENWCPFIICIIFSGIFVYYFRNANYADGDTMTHWGVIVRAMYERDGLPNFQDTAVAYQSYPPATACWIYYVLKFTGYGENYALLAQALWSFCCGICLFALNKSRQLAGDILIGVSIVYYLKNMSDLRVDYLLAVISLAAVAGIACYVSEQNVAGKELLYFVLPFIGILPMVKNSGVLFAVFLSFILLWAFPHMGCRRLWTIAYTGLTLGVALSSLYLWKAHIKMVYADANASRHSLSITYMESVAESRSLEDYAQIIKAFISKWFSFNGTYEWLMIVLIIMLGITAMALIPGKRKTAGFITVMSLISYLIYKLGLLGMYLFNMPGNSYELEAYVRYQTTFTSAVTVSIFLLYFMLAEEIRQRVWKKTQYICSIVSLSLILLFINYSGAGAHLKHPDYVNGGVHRRLLSMIHNTPEINEGDKALVYLHYGLAVHFVRFTFHNQECIASDNLVYFKNALMDNSMEFDTIIIFDRDETIQELLRSYGYDPDLEYINLK